jgi:hypothetical protein
MQMQMMQMRAAKAGERKCLSKDETRPTGALMDRGAGKALGHVNQS